MAACACCLSSDAQDWFTNAAIPRIQIEIKPESLANLKKDSREFVSVKVTAGRTVYPQVAIRLKGATGSFRPIEDKPSLTLDFSRFQAGQKFHGLRRIHLNNSVEDPSYANEKLGSEIFQAAGVPAPRVTRALVELNGRALGLYVLKEGFTEDFLARHFQKISGELYEAGEGHDVNEKLDRNSVHAPFDTNRVALKNISAALIVPPAERWQKIEATLDAKNFLAFMALEIMLGHRDGYCLMRNNFRVYHDLDSGRVMFFPSGMDQLFGTPDLSWQPHLSGAVAVAVMETTEGRQKYAETFSALLTNLFKASELTNRIEQLTTELRPVLSRSEWSSVRAAADELKQHIVQRAASLRAQLSQPPMRPLEFADGSARPGDWKIAQPPRAGKMDRVETGGVTALHIQAGAETSASWSVRVLLPRGRYRFEGRARTAGVEPLPFGTHQGAALRIGGSARIGDGFTGTGDWRKLTTEFNIEPIMKETDLICELRARAGEVWFDLPSLVLIKINEL